MLITRILPVIPALNPCVHNVPGVIKVTNFNLEGYRGETCPEMRLSVSDFCTSKAVWKDLLFLF